MTPRLPRFSATFLLCLIVLIGTAIVAPTASFARETRTFADTYTIDIGFISEPPIQNDTNGLQIRVIEGEQPVEGLESTLNAQAVYAGEARELPLTPVPGDPGLYRSVFIPTQPGEYSFLITGTIGELAIEETFHSSPDGVPMVASRLDYEFPTAAQGAVGNAASPAMVGAALLLAGSIGYVVRRNRA
jgi:hypothetical protein